jgi:hypothetical protein
MSPGQSGAWEGNLYTDRREANPGSIVPREIADKALARAKEELEKLDDKAREVVCKKLKEQYPDNQQIQAIDCSASSTEQIVSAALVVAGAAAGTAICGPVCGTAGGMIGGAIAAAYGKDIAEFLDDGWDSVEGYAEDALDGISDGYDYVVDIF